MHRTLDTQPANGIRKVKRSGLTLAEVLVSMGILVVGLLGVAALFPVGGHYMQTGDVADQAGTIAQAALDDAVVRGYLDPENWFCLDIDAFKNGAAVRPNSLANALRGSYSLPAATQPIVDGLGSQYRDGAYGAAIVIDPLGMAAILEDPTPNTPPALVWQGFAQSARTRRFPATTGNVNYRALSVNGASWQPWNLNLGLTRTWPIRRVSTTIDPDSVFATRFDLYSPAAENSFTATDDLALILPDNGDDPSRGRWTTWSDGTQALTARRQARGDYSWLISVSPGSSTARDALATTPDAHPYDVSVVVFHKRVLAGWEDSIEAERLVNAKVVSTGTAGGELLLERRPNGTSSSEDPVSGSPFEDLRTGEYIMLTGPHPLSTSQRPMLFLQWYRVLSIEDSGRPTLDGAGNEARLSRDGNETPSGGDLLTSNTARVLVSLRGPDWPWQPTNDLTQTDQLPNDLRVAIIPGAVAVHTKTMRLESGTPWSID